jgi:ATP-dependent 26S proteasome regulatory subunit
MFSKNNKETYNALFTYLDNNQNEKISNIKVKSNQTQKSNYEPDEYTKKKEFINTLSHIDKIYRLQELNCANFAGWNCIDVIVDNIEEKINPNLYPSQIIYDKNKNKYKNKNKNTSHTSRTSPKSKHNLSIKTEVEKEKINISIEVTSILDLLKLIELYPIDEKKEYNININILHKIKEPLINLNAMIGMNELKENILDQILFYLQNLHNLNNDSHEQDFLHTVIYGPPGTGKTEIAKLIGKVFANLGILDKGTFRKVTRSDLIAGYLGQTAIKTKDVIKDALGGVLFIDEAYALGNSEKRDSFSKECIDTLCEAASDYKSNLMIIIAGYENELNECFFNYNAGLNSRFTWRFKTDEYTGEDLYKIFLKKVKDADWTISQDEPKIEKQINKTWFEKNKEYFTFYGRDIETLFAKTKIAHSRRIFGKPECERKCITMVDLNKGFDIFLHNEEVKKRKTTSDIHKSLTSMYI